MTSTRQVVRQISVSSGLLLTGLAGYVGFVAVAGTDRSLAAGTLALAAAVGFAAFFSPCSFPLLLTFLARSASSSARAALARAMRVGVGASLLLALLGGVIAAVGGGIAGGLNFSSPGGRVLRVGVAVFLVLMGLRQAGRIRARIGWFDRVSGFAGTRPALSGDNSGRADVLYGFGYLLAGFG